MAWTRAALALVAAGAVGVAVVSGGSDADPRTPAALPGLPPPFLGTAVVGDGGLTAAIDAYGDVVDLRAPGPAGRPLIDNPAARQAAGSVPADTGIVPRVSVDGGPALSLWHAGSVSQRYLPGTNVVRTTARFRRARVVVTAAAAGATLALTVDAVAPPGVHVQPMVGVDLESGTGGHCRRMHRSDRIWLLCGASMARSVPGPAGTGPKDPPRPKATSGADGVGPAVERNVHVAAVRDRRWVARARPLGRTAPGWARRMYGRSLLTLHALTDRRTGAIAAGARDGWAYVWPRDAGTAVLAFAAAAYPAEARRTARFLRRLDLDAAARFYGNGAPVPGREAQGDAAGWVAVAARAAGIPPPTARLPWRNRPDYQEGSPGNYLANAIASAPKTPVDGPISPLYEGKSARQPRGTGGAAGFGGLGGLVREGGIPARGSTRRRAGRCGRFRSRRCFQQCAGPSSG